MPATTATAAPTTAAPAHSTEPRIVKLRDLKLFSLVMAPIRIEIAEMLRCMGPSTIAQLAQHLARPADTLYRHMRLLEKTGLVASTTIRQPGKRSESVYRFVPDDITPAFPADRKGQIALASTAAPCFRAVARALDDSARAQRLRFGELPPGEYPNISILYELGWLTPESLRKARGLLAQLKQLMDEGKRSAQGELFITAAVLTPVTRTHTRAGKPAMPTQRKPKRTPQADD